MPKRFFAIVAAAAAGFALAQSAARQSGAPSWWPDRDRERNVKYFRDVLQVVKENYVDGAKAGYDGLTRAALKGMVAQLDPHSEFLTAEEFAATEDDLSNEFTGVGIRIEQRDGKIVVVTPIADTPAERAGIRRGDQLLKVDGRALDHPGVDQTISLIRGEPGSRVVLTIFRPSQNKALDFALQRERIRLDSVRHVQLRSDGIGYVQITQFGEHTGEEFTQALAALEKQGLRALVIDLRNNPGGLLDAAIDVCDPFFERGELIAYTQGRTPASREDHLADGSRRPRAYPVAILINGGTASAAEIVTGAMRDTKRAVIVGEKSFGKGSVQSVIPLKNGEGLRLTVAKYFTPGGVSIHEKGIQPQVEIELSPDDEAKIRLQEARNDLAAPAEFAARFGFQPVEDLQLLAAQEVLTGVLAARAVGK
ncbi:MAG: S41 family peptidase [Opitutae bacterium]|nr:S41 family peptidase [Opitutae bacterium]